jgi:hypothetical protein
VASGEPVAPPSTSQLTSSTASAWSSSSSEHRLGIKDITIVDEEFFVPFR